MRIIKPFILILTFSSGLALAYTYQDKCPQSLMNCLDKRCSDNDFCHSDGTCHSVKDATKEEKDKLDACYNALENDFHMPKPMESDEYKATYQRLLNARMAEIDRQDDRIRKK